VEECEVTDRDLSKQRQAHFKDLAHARTLPSIATEKVNGVADDHPQRTAFRRKLHEVNDKLRAAERAFEVER
jgi:hypothetical protein